MQAAQVIHSPLSEPLRSEPSGTARLDESRSTPDDPGPIATADQSVVTFPGQNPARSALAVSRGPRVPPPGLRLL